MGEYAVDQMMEDFKLATGMDAERSDFEPEERTPRRAGRPRCAKCGKKFLLMRAVRDHMRDKHKEDK